MLRALLLSTAFLAASVQGNPQPTCTNGFALSANPAYIATTSANTNVNLNSGPFCNCYSGFTPDQTCTNNAATTCAPSSPDPYQTTAIADFTSSNFANSSGGILAFTISSPYTASRFFEGVTLTTSAASLSDGTSTNQADPACAYPTSPYLSRSWDSGCADVITSNLPLSLVLGTCLNGLAADTTTNSGYDTYPSMLTIFVGETVTSSTNSQFSATRSIQSSLLLSLQLANTISVTSSANVSSPITLDALLVGQAFDRTTNTATITILTQIAQPYTLGTAAPTLTTSTTYSPAASAQAPTTTTCPGSPGAPSGFNDAPLCQLTTFTVTNLGTGTTGPQCSLSGTFALVWKYDCVTTSSDCVPVTPEATVSATFTLASNNLCAQTSVVSSLTAALAVTGGSGDGSVFTSGQTSTFTLSAVSSTIPVKSFTITEVVVSYTSGAAPGSQTLTFYSGSPATTLAAVVSSGWTLTATGLNPSFSFNPSTSLFGVQVGSDPVSFTVTVTASVTYSTSFSGPVGKKRGIQVETKTFTRQGVFYPAVDAKSESTAQVSEFGSSSLLYGAGAVALILVGRKALSLKKRMI